MGADGGSFTKRTEMVKLKREPERLKRREARRLLCFTCPVSQAPLQPPLVACGLGNLYSKEALVHALVAKRPLPAAVAHVRSLRDVFDVRMTPNSSAKRGKSSGIAEALTGGPSPWMCPLSSKVFNALTEFCAIRPCGCVMTMDVLSELSGTSCHNCGTAFDPDHDVVPLFPEGPVLEGRRAIVAAEQEAARAKRAAARDAKRAAKAAARRASGAAGTHDDDDADGKGDAVDAALKKRKRRKKKGGGDGRGKRVLGSPSVDPSATKKGRGIPEYADESVYKSLFVSTHFLMGNTHAPTKKLFDQFDLDKTGVLSLKELLEIRQIEDLEFALKSPALLFAFDEGQDGALSFQEFAKLLRHLRAAKKKTRLAAEAAPQQETGKRVWTTIGSHDRVHMKISRDETPMFTGRVSAADNAVMPSESTGASDGSFLDEDGSSHGSSGVGMPTGPRAGKQQVLSSEDETTSEDDDDGPYFRARPSSSTSSSSSSSSEEGGGEAGDEVGHHASSDDDAVEEVGPLTQSDTNVTPPPPQLLQSQPQPLHAQHHRAPPPSSPMRGPRSSVVPPTLRVSDTSAAEHGEEEDEEGEGEEEEPVYVVGGRSVPVSVLSDGLKPAAAALMAAAATAAASSGGNDDINGDVVTGDGGGGGGGGDGDDNTALVAPMSASAPAPETQLLVPDPDDEKRVRALSAEKRRDLLDLLRTAEGRRQYMTWLFRLADVGKTGHINMEELSLILQALQLDGVELERLCYDQEERERVHDLTARIMQEYDTGKDGVLTLDEFMVLAEVVVQNYETDTSDEVLLGGRYRLSRKLGTGSSGVVRLAKDLRTGAKKAVKIIQRGDVSDMSRVDKEIQAMLMLRHPNIAALECVLESDSEVFFVMELCGGGSLADYVELKPLSEDLARFYFGQLVGAVYYCHQQGVVHRDLKLENLLLDNEGNLKVADFGHAGIFKVGWDMFSTCLIGSLWHVAPEQVKGEVYSGEKLDVWAIGVALYRMLVGEPPFTSDSPTDMLDKVRHARFTIPSHLSLDVQSLLRSILQANPKDRPSPARLLAVPWLLAGRQTRPCFNRIDIILDSMNTDVSATWSTMLHALRKCNVVCTVPQKGNAGDAQRRKDDPAAPPSLGSPPTSPLKAKPRPLHGSPTRAISMPDKGAPLGPQLDPAPATSPFALSPMSPTFMPPSPLTVPSPAVVVDDYLHTTSCLYTAANLKMTIKLMPMSSMASSGASPGRSPRRTRSYKSTVGEEEESGGDAASGVRAVGGGVGAVAGAAGVPLHARTAEVDIPRRKVSGGASIGGAASANKLSTSSGRASPLRSSSPLRSTSPHRSTSPRRVASSPLSVERSSAVMTASRSHVSLDAKHTDGASEGAKEEAQDGMGPPFFRFHLRQGESREFQALVDRIQSTFGSLRAKRAGKKS